MFAAPAFTLATVMSSCCLATRELRLSRRNLLVGGEERVVLRLHLERDG